METPFWRRALGPHPLHVPFHLIDRDIRGTDRGILLNAARKCGRLSRYGFLGGSQEDHLLGWSSDWVPAHRAVNFVVCNFQRCVDGELRHILEFGIQVALRCDCRFHRACPSRTCDALNSLVSGEKPASRAQSALRANSASMTKSRDLLRVCNQ